MEREELATMIAAGWTLEQMAERVGRHPSTMSYWLRKHGLAAVNTERHRSRGPIARAELASFVDTGMSIAELAEALDRSKATVRHWLRRYELKTLQATRRAQRRAAVDAASAAGSPAPAHLAMRCRHHGETTFVRETSGYYRCGRCRVESVANHRRRLKETLVAEAGGRCAVCGYDRHRRALEFHHVDPRGKSFALSGRGVIFSLRQLRTEAAKCVLLCSNCHAEVEDGRATLPIQ